MYLKVKNDQKSVFSKLNRFFSHFTSIFAAVPSYSCLTNNGDCGEENFCLPLPSNPADLGRTHACYRPVILTVPANTTTSRCTTCMNYLSSTSISIITFLYSMVFLSKATTAAQHACLVSINCTQH